MDSTMDVDAVNSDVVVDGDWGIIAADEGFSAISGNDLYVIFTRYIHPDDVKRFVKAIKDSAGSETTYVVARMMYATGEYHWMLLRVSDAGATSKAGQAYNINIMDVASVTIQIDRLGDEVDKLSCYIGLTENMLFSYDIENDVFSLFVIADGQQTMKFYSGSLEEWKKEKKEAEVLDEESVKELDALCVTLTNGEKFFKRKMNVNVFSNADSDACLVRGKTITDTHGKALVIGIVTVVGTDAEGGVADEITLVSDMRDPGTDLLNKRAITDYVRNLIDSRPGHNVTIAIIDIDDFKTINDVYGHMFGDEVLSKVANILREAVGKKGLCGRIGGDEMFIVMEGLKGDEGIRNVLRTIRNNILWMYHDDSRDINKISCSIGSATYPTDAKDYDELFKIADKMLYLAKEKGKDRYIIYHEDIHREYVYGMGRIVDTTEKVFYKYRKLMVVNTVIRDYKEATDARRKEILEMIALAFDIDSVVLYTQKPAAKHVLYGEQRMAEDDGSYLREANYIAGFSEDGTHVIDNTNFYENKAPKLFKVFSKYGISQAVQYIIGGSPRKGNNNVISYMRFKQGKKWAIIDINFLAIIGDYIGNVELNER